jgi:hypothetical protein
MDGSSPSLFSIFCIIPLEFFRRMDFVCRSTFGQNNFYAVGDMIYIISIIFAVFSFIKETVGFQGLQKCVE